MVAVVCDRLFSSASKYQEEAADGGNKGWYSPNSGTDSTRHGQAGNKRANLKECECLYSGDPRCSAEGDHCSECAARDCRTSVGESSRADRRSVFRVDSTLTGIRVVVLSLRSTIQSCGTLNAATTARSRSGQYCSRSETLEERNCSNAWRTSLSHVRTQGCLAAIASTAEEGE
jgi:hypothetical protein